MAGIDRIARILDARTLQRTTIQDRVMRAVLELVSTFDAWYSGTDIRALTERITTYVEAGQVQIANLTNAYLAQVAYELTGRSLAPAPLIQPATLRAGVAHDEVYARLAAHYRYLISQGATEVDALAAVQTRARTLTHMDMLLSVTHQARGWQEFHNWRMFRRVIRPEASRTGVCGLCLVASDRLYYRGDLLPVHDNCFCDVILVTRENDPGSVLNRDTLDELYADANYSTHADELRHTKYVIAEHGELGPILIRDGDNFRDARAVIAATTH